MTLPLLSDLNVETNEFVERRIFFKDKMTGPIETQLLINNKLVAASDNATFDLFSPHTGELVAKGNQLSPSFLRVKLHQS
jgi:hypothetical protein